MRLFSDPKPIVLHPHQGVAVELLRDGIRAGHRRQILVAPTAFGKTECAAHIIQESQKKGSRAWFIVDRVNLIDQTSARFSHYGIDHGIIQADNPFSDPGNPVQIASAQTLARRTIHDLPDLIIQDEAHCQYKAITDLIERAERSKVIGLTATPFTPGMAAHWDGVVNGATTNELLAKGFLAPLKVKACVAPDMAGAKTKVGGEYEDEEAGARGITIVGDVVSTWIEQTGRFFGGPVKTIVFSPSVKHGAELCRQFADAGYNFQQISYLDASDDERREKIAEFRKLDSAIDGLVSCAVLTKGFDVPDVLCGISCRPYRKSLSSHVQELGRVMRTSEETGKTFGLWLDHSGNCVTFADETAWLYEHGVESLSEASKKDSVVRKPIEKEKSDRFCGGCGMQMEPRIECCACCGWERPKRGEIQVVQGNLIDFDLSASNIFKARSTLHAECLRSPRAMWNAALAYCMAHGRKGPEASRKWAFGIWSGIYPGSRLPRGLYEAPCSTSSVQADEWSLIEREVKRFRKNSSRRAA